MGRGLGLCGCVPRKRKGKSNMKKEKHAPRGKPRRLSANERPSDDELVTVQSIPKRPSGDNLEKEGLLENAEPSPVVTLSPKQEESQSDRKSSSSSSSSSNRSSSGKKSTSQNGTKANGETDVDIREKTGGNKVEDEVPATVVKIDAVESGKTPQISVAPDVICHQPVTDERLNGTSPDGSTFPSDNIVLDKDKVELDKNMDSSSASSFEMLDDAISSTSSQDGVNEVKALPDIIKTETVDPTEHQEKVVSHNSSEFEADDHENQFTSSETLTETEVAANGHKKKGESYQITKQLSSSLSSTQTDEFMDASNLSDVYFSTESVRAESKADEQKQATAKSYANQPPEIVQPIADGKTINDFSSSSSSSSDSHVIDVAITKDAVTRKENEIESPYIAVNHELSTSGVLQQQETGKSDDVKIPGGSDYESALRPRSSSSSSQSTDDDSEDNTIKHESDESIEVTNSDVDVSDDTHLVVEDVKLQVAPEEQNIDQRTSYSSSYDGNDGKLSSKVESPTVQSHIEDSKLDSVDNKSLSSSSNSSSSKESLSEAVVENIRISAKKQGDSPLNSSISEVDAAKPSENFEITNDQAGVENKPKDPEPTIVPEVETKHQSPLSSSSSSENKNSVKSDEVKLAEEQSNLNETRQRSSSSSSASSLSEDSETTNEEPSKDGTEKDETPFKKDSLTTMIRKHRENITFWSGWRKMVTLVDLVKARLVTEKTVEQLESGTLDENKVAEDLQLYLNGTEPIAGLLLMETGEKMSFYDASKKRLVRRGTAVSLLEAQAATGSIIDPYSGTKMNVEEAEKAGLIDKFLLSVLTRAERAACGFKSKLSDRPLSLFDAMKRNLVVESHGIRLLEAQVATGGIIDPWANHRIPVDVAYERGLFDERLNKILENPADDTKGFFDPNTNQNLTYLQLTERCVFDEETSLRLLPLYKKKQKKDYWKKAD